MSYDDGSKRGFSCHFEDGVVKTNLTYVEAIMLFSEAEGTDNPVPFVLLVMATNTKHHDKERRTTGAPEASKDSKELPWWGRIFLSKLINAVENIDEQEESV